MRETDELAMGHDMDLPISRAAAEPKKLHEVNLVRNQVEGVDIKVGDANLHRIQKRLHLAERAHIDCVQVREPRVVVVPGQLKHSAGGRTVVERRTRNDDAGPSIRGCRAPVVGRKPFHICRKHHPFVVHLEQVSAWTWVSENCGKCAPCGGV